MFTKFPVQKLFSLPLAQQITTCQPLLSLTNFAKHSYHFLVSQYQKGHNYEDQRESALTDWNEARFHFFSPSGATAGSASTNEQSFSRNIHYSSYQLENKDKGESKGSSNITYAVVPKEKSDIVANFLIRYYHKEEPVSLALGLPIEEVEGWFQRFIRRSMFASIIDVSVQAVDEHKGKRVGVLSSIIIDPTRSRPFLNDFTDPEKHPVSMKMNEFYDSLEKGLNPAEAIGFKVESQNPPKLLEHLYVSVHPDYAKQGISNSMVKLSESLASTINHCRIGYTIATSEFSYAIFLKNGYQVVRESKYADYTNSKGEKIFAGKEEILKPHHTCRAMVKEIKCLY